MSGGRTVTGFACVALVAVMLFPQVAAAETVAQLQTRLAQLKKENQAAGKAYSDAFWALDETDVRLEKLDADIVETDQKLSEARTRLGDRVNSIYRRDSDDTIAFLVGAQSFQEFVTRYEFLARIGKADAEAVAEVTALQLRLSEQKTRLAEQRKQQAADVKALRAQRDKLQKRLKSQEAEFLSVKAKLDKARSGGKTIPSGVKAVAGPNGMVFPVVGSYYYADTWGASRSGGRRRHQGTDIMARKGTPCVAVMSGTVRSKTSSLGGKTIWLTADNGWQFYYAHLDSWVVTSGRVKAGQLIGKVGSTGNASASAPHLHFEIHPGGGAAVNPYPYLRKME